MDLSVLDSKRKRILSLLNKVPIDDSVGLELQSHWARYAVVIISGSLEDSIRTLLRQYAQDHASPRIADHASSQLERFQSAKTEEIASLLSRFDKQWEKQFNEYLTEEIKAAVNSVVGQRHLVAHGRDSTVTISQLKAWFPKIDDMLLWIAVTLLTNR